MSNTFGSAMLCTHHLLRKLRPAMKAEDDRKDISYSAHTNSLPPPIRITYRNYRKATTGITDFNFFFPSFLPGKSDQTLFLVESGRKNLNPIYNVLTLHQRPSHTVRVVANTIESRSKLPPSMLPRRTPAPPTGRQTIVISGIVHQTPPKRLSITVSRSGRTVYRTPSRKGYEWHS